MYTATLTRQGQITIPSKMRKRMEVKGGDKLNFIVRGRGIEVSKATGWESLKGVLAEFKGNYPSKREIARAHVADEKNTGRYQRLAQISG